MSPSWRVLDRVEAVGHGVQEDSAKISGDLAWVIDGASPLSDERLTEAPSDARWIVEVAESFLSRAGQRGDPRPLSSLVGDTAAAISRLSEQWPFQPTYPPSAALGVVRNLGETVEYLVLSDVVIAIDAAQPLVWTDAAAESGNEEAMVTFRRLLRQTGSFAQARAAVTPLLVKHRETSMNTPGGYWVLADDPSVAAHAISGEVPVEEVPRILLCSDGFSRVVDVFGMYASWADFFEAGPPLEVALRDLRAMEAGDPECKAFPRWSVSDDVTALLIAPS